MNPLNLYNFDLPNGWTIEKLSNFVDIIMGQSPPSETYNKRGEGLPFFQGKAEFGAIYPTVEKYCSEPNKIARQGDVLLSIRAPVGPTNLAPLDCCIGRGLAALHPLDSISSRFILYLFRSLEPQISKEGTGSTFKAINKQFVENLTVALPPLEEQIRIVDKVEENFSELDKGIEYLKTAQEQLKVYRQSVLKAAFGGKLTEQWRESHADQLETANQLLERIQQERENRYQQQLNDWEEAVKVWEESGKEGRKSSKPKEPEIVPSLTEIDTVNLPELPDSWTWISLAHVKELSMYGPRFSSKDYIDEGVAILRTTDVSDSGKVDWENSPKLLISDDEYEKYKLVKGDLLITRTGSIGTVSVFNDDKKAIAGAFLIHYRLATHINSWFIFYFLKSQRAQNHFHEYSKGSGRPNLNVPNIELLIIPLPSFEEQDKIVQMLEEKISILDSFETIISEALKKNDVLRQSILKKAFSGRLVPQDPNDGPASSLLERIRAERLAAPKPTRKPSTSKKTPRKKEVVDLISVLQSAKDWLSAQDAFRECGVGDGAETDVIEKLYLELRDLEKEDRIEVERRGDEDWLRIRSTGRS